ncbi:hypothetical protein D918_02091 [Trichuris suis]|nr:hypothetical protein D918_02091 [Trichuris suis]
MQHVDCGWSAISQEHRNSEFIRVTDNPISQASVSSCEYHESAPSDLAGAQRAVIQAETCSDNDMQVSYVPLCP